MRVRLPLMSAVALCLAGATAAAQRPANAPGGRGGGAGGAAPAAQPEGVAAVERVSTTQHTITIGGRQIAYTSRAGTMVIRGDDGKNECAAPRGVSDLLHAHHGTPTADAEAEQGEKAPVARGWVRSGGRLRRLRHRSRPPRCRLRW